MQLVREAGALASVGLLASLRCREIDLQGQWRRASGKRGYDGVTNLGREVQSQADIRSDELELSVRLKAFEGSGNRLQPGGGLVYRRLSRNLRSVGAVLGYPEVFQAVAPYAAISLAWPSSAWHNETTLQVGPVWAGQVRVELPRADPAVLKTGRGTAWAVHQRVALGMGQGRLQSQLDISLGAAQTSAGPASPLYRNGVLVGSARQPRFRSSHLGANLSLLW